ncbi:hypothetical protein D3C86_1902650 [compost metagenome]
MHYLDAAWEELGIGNQIDIANAFDTSIEMAMTRVISLIGDLEHPNGKSSKTLLTDVKYILTDLLNELRSTTNKLQRNSV